jgi:hypothetical protein
VEKRVTTPKGKVITLPDEFTPEMVDLAVQEADKDVTVAPSAPAGKAKTIVDFIGQLMKTGALGPGAEGLQLGASAAKRELTNPENISAITATGGGLAGGAAGGAMIGGPVGAPVGALLGALLGGFGGSKLLEGKTTGAAMQDAAGDAMFEPVSPLIKGVVAPTLHAASRGAVRAGLRPTRAVLDEIAASHRVETPGNAARIFGAEGAELLDKTEGSPGGNRFAMSMIGLDKASRADKVAGIKSSQALMKDTDLIPPGAFDDLVSKLAAKHGDAVEQTPAIDEAVRKSLSRSSVTPARQNLPGQRPLLSPATRGKNWTPTEVDARIGGLQEDLDNFFSERNKDAMMRNPSHANVSEQATATIRNEMARALTQAVPRGGSGKPMLAINRELNRRIPITGAAIDATEPLATEGIPRVRVAGSFSRPNVQAYDYVSRAFRHAARPARGAAKMSEKLAAGSPALARLLAAIFERE